MALKYSFASIASLLLLAFAESAYGHGALTLFNGVAPRGVVKGQNTDSYNNPVDVNTSAFVCRNHPQAAVAQTTIAAGSKVPALWEFPAPHVGDCAFYLSYDNEKTWFKFAYVPDCKHLTTPFQLQIPSMIPSCDRCVIRYEWIALHISTSSAGPAEFYSQCVDVAITSSYTGSLPAPTVVIPGHIKSNGPFRQPFNPNAPVPSPPGPPIASVNGQSINPGSPNTNTPTTPNTPTAPTAPTTPTAPNTPTTPTTPTAPTTPNTPTTPTTPTTPNTPTTPTTPETPSTVTDPGSTDKANVPSNDSSSNQLGVGIGIGMGVGILVACGAVAGFVLYQRSQFRSSSAKDSGNPFNSSTHITSPTSIFSKSSMV